MHLLATSKGGSSIYVSQYFHIWWNIDPMWGCSNGSITRPRVCLQMMESDFQLHTPKNKNSILKSLGKNWKGQTSLLNCIDWMWPIKRFCLFQSFCAKTFYRFQFPYQFVVIYLLFPVPPCFSLFVSFVYLLYVFLQNSINCYEVYKNMQRSGINFIRYSTRSEYIKIIF